MRRLVVCLLLLAGTIGLSACGAESVWAPNAEVAKYRYVAAPPRTISLVTVVNNVSGEGGHSALIINAPEQQVAFDPAGTWTNPYAPERNDVHFGMTPGVIDNFLDYHTRVTWHTVVQTIPVTPEVAQMALQLVEKNGPADKAFCADTNSKILRELPGFGSMPQTFFPVTLMDAFAKLPGVKTRVYYDNDPDVNTTKIEVDGKRRPQYATGNG